MSFPASYNSMVYSLKPRDWHPGFFFQDTLKAKGFWFSDIHISFQTSASSKFSKNLWRNVLCIAIKDPKVNLLSGTVGSENVLPPQLFTYRRVRALAITLDCDELALLGSGRLALCCPVLSLLLHAHYCWRTSLSGGLREGEQVKKHFPSFSRHV